MDKVMKWVLITLLMGGVGVVIGGAFASGVPMTSNAMEPTIANGDSVFVSSFALKTRDPRRGEAVLMQAPGEDGLIVRRVVGLPGETLELRDGVLYINGGKVEEPYLHNGDEPKIENPAPISYGPISLADKQYFVLGDFRKGAVDSRTFGVVTRDHIYGKAWVFGSLPI